jgi:hypothetical protein
MAEMVEQVPTGAVAETDLVAAVRRVLERSAEPLTLSKIRAALPSSFRSISLEALDENLGRQAAANVLVQYPKYRSPQNRYWDRPMPAHLAWLLRGAVEEKPLTLSELRRKLPDYARNQADSVLEEEVARGGLFRHPALSARTGPRFGARRPDPKDYLLAELAAAFNRLEQLGFNKSDLRECALEVLHEEEWASTLDRQTDQTKTGPRNPAQGAAPAERREQANGPDTSQPAFQGENNPS